MTNDDMQAQIDELKQKIQTKDLAFGLLVGQFLEAKSSCPPCFQKSMSALIEDLFGSKIILEGFKEVIDKSGILR